MQSEQAQAGLRAEIEARLRALVALPAAKRQRTVADAMAYSLLGGGKRLRGILTLSFCELFCGERGRALDAACALEMVHAYSLIHDDLPCMDDDDLRRGKPSCHIRYGEAMALLAGDALLTLAFETLLSPQQRAALGAESCAEMALALSRAAGIGGMVGGQTADLEGEGQPQTLEALLEMYAMKTGALLSAAVELGAIAGGADEGQRTLALEYAGRVGLAFQVADDLLDITSDTATLGKPVGSDAKDDKTTVASLLGLKEAQALVAALTEQALGILDELAPGESFLHHLTAELATRSC